MLIITYIISNYYNKESKTIVFAYVLLILVAGLRPGDCCNDYWNYVEFYKQSKDAALFQLEPTFFIIVIFSKLLQTGVVGFFVIYAIIALVIKYFAIKRLTEFHFLSFLYFFSYFFLVHEMTQIRSAVATSVLLLSLPDIYKRNAYSFYLKILFGAIFHYSFLFFSFFYFLNPKRYNALFFCLLPFIGYVMYFSGLNLVKVFDLVNLRFLSEKITAYKTVLKAGGFAEINVINILMVVRISLLIFFSYHVKEIYEHNKYFFVLLKIYSFSLFLFSALADIPVFAFRLSELLGIVEIIIIPFIIYIVKPLPVSVTAIILVAIGMLSFQLFYNHLVFTYFGS